MTYFGNNSEYQINKGIKDIISMDRVTFHFDRKNKEHVFLLGIIFAAGKQVKVTNLDQLAVIHKGDINPKSFDLMLRYWAEKDLKPEISNLSTKNNIFLICPIAKATEYQQEKIDQHISDIDNCYNLYYPAKHTNQIDVTGGYRICTDNANAIGNANTIHIFYDNTSTGSMFDLGVAYYFQYLNLDRQFCFVNKEEIELSNDDFGDYIMKLMLNKEHKVFAKIKHNKTR